VIHDDNIRNDFVAWDDDETNETEQFRNEVRIIWELKASVTVLIFIFILDNTLINRKAALIMLFRYQNSALGLARLSPWARGAPFRRRPT
jgi:hypothetical protein